ncbi:MAG: PQQ-dependent sugar dehydrogenase [Rhodopila sp.]
MTTPAGGFRNSQHSLSKKGYIVRLNKIVLRSLLVLSVAMGLAFATGLALSMGLGFDKVVGGTFRNYFGVSAATLLKSPLALWRIHERASGSFKELQYTQEHGGVYSRRYLETVLLPLIVDGKRLSDSYPVPKMGGAITVVGTTVVILDRLGGLYRYDVTTGSFGLLPGIPRLPNNLDAYLVQRPGPPVNLADAPNDDFRARDIIFLSDRSELAAAYDKFDETLGKMRTVVSVIRFDVTTLAAAGGWQEIFASDAFAASEGIASGAGRLAYNGGGDLYVAVGGHDIVYPKVSEDPNTTLGKIIEINLNTNKWRQFTKGHRNQEGLTFLKSGQLFSTEHGPRGGDELNEITEGSDYGWPNVTLGSEYNTYAWDAGTSLVVGSHAGYKAPLFAWVPSIAPTQVIEVTDFDPRWDGDLLVGSLKAASLYRLRLEADRVLYSERIWIGERIRDLAQTNDGTIILWTDDTQLLFITVDRDQLAVKRRTPNIIGTGLINDDCLGCHHFGPTNPTDFAPTLSNLLNRPIASDAFSYSPALRAKQKLGAWTPALLSEFLSDTYKFASGTAMPALRIEPADLDDIVATLVRASDHPTASVPTR